MNEMALIDILYGAGKILAFAKKCCSEEQRNVLLLQNLEDSCLIVACKVVHPSGSFDHEAPRTSWSAFSRPTRR